MEDERIEDRGWRMREDGGVRMEDGVASFKVCFSP